MGLLWSRYGTQQHFSPFSTKRRSVLLFVHFLPALARAQHDGLPHGADVGGLDALCARALLDADVRGSASHRGAPRPARPRRGGGRLPAEPPRRARLGRGPARTAAWRPGRPRRREKAAPRPSSIGPTARRAAPGPVRCRRDGSKRRLSSPCGPNERGPRRRDAGRPVPRRHLAQNPPGVALGPRRLGAGLRPPRAQGLLPARGPRRLHQKGPLARAGAAGSRADEAEEKAAGLLRWRGAPRSSSTPRTTFATEP